MLKKQKGFTLIELLVVIAIIGLLSTLAVVALNNARQKARDAKRVADWKQIQTALELYATENGGSYPTGTALALGAGTDCTTACDVITQESGIVAAAGSDTVLMGLIPADPNGTAECAGTPTASCISSYTVGSPATTYSILGYIEGDVGDLGAGACTITQSGITCQ